MLQSYIMHSWCGGEVTVSQSDFLSLHLHRDTQVMFTSLKFQFPVSDLDTNMLFSLSWSCIADSPLR